MALKEVTVANENNEQEINLVKAKELSKLTGASKASISIFFKDVPNDLVARSNNRIVGITPKGVYHFLQEKNINIFERGSIILSANLCGGVGKTSSTDNLAACLRRLIQPETHIVLIDGDSQASLTTNRCKEPAADNEMILLDYLEQKASLKEILTSLGNNTWIIKSNLNQAWADKTLSKPQDIKTAMLKLYKDIFENFGNNTKIFQDHAPQLSTILASSVAAAHQLPPNILTSLIIPLRSDSFAIQGGDYIIKEVYELQETFNLEPEKINIHCFFSSIDMRISSTSEAIKAVKEKERVLEHLSPVVIRYCSEIPKSIMKKSNVYTSKKGNNAAYDYLDLLNSIFSGKL